MPESSAYVENSSHLDKNGLALLLEKFAIKLNFLDIIYPAGIVIELKNNIDPSVVIGGNWKDVTSSYTSGNANTKKWQRIIPVDSDKTQLQNNYNQYKDTDKNLYTEASWPQFATALENARIILNDVEATQEEVDNTSRALIVAYLSLRRK